MLKHTLQRLQNKKPLTVAYFGGSITEGAGASSPDKCWRSKITAYLKAAYPASEITEIQAAIGGTDSALGIFRADNDVLRYHPDLVFL
ncbi:MAG: SGNH/GDSL hydrolase family protein [Clostridia bacterium]|nr:SGNH/GDSL hydrolase family protein [Clostridia bacterium]